MGTCPAGKAGAYLIRPSGGKPAGLEGFYSFIPQWGKPGLMVYVSCRGKPAASRGLRLEVDRRVAQLAEDVQSFGVLRGSQLQRGGNRVQRVRRAGGGG